MLDESFGSYLEDAEFGLRCALADRDGTYQPDAVAFHRGSASLGPWNKDTVRLIARNQMLIAAKHFAGQPRWPLMVGQALWGLVALRHGRLLSYLRGKLAGLRDSHSVRAQQHPPERMAKLLQTSEQDILELQQQTGFEPYWRIYFWLSRW
jgi:GT2 family glycosyltransferase